MCVDWLMAAMDYQDFLGMMLDFKVIVKGISFRICRTGKSRAETVEQRREIVSSS